MYSPAIPSAESPRSKLMNLPHFIEKENLAWMVTGVNETGGQSSTELYSVEGPEHGVQLRSTREASANKVSAHHFHSHRAVRSPERRDHDIKM